MKRCSKCKLEKRSDEFKKHKGHIHGLSSQCRVCIREYRQRPEIKARALASQREWRQRPENSEKIKAWSKRFRESDYGQLWIMDDNLKRNYGIGISKYNELFAEQGGRCSICEKHQSDFPKRLAVDHDHITGDVRALLCHHCNTALGAFDENEDLLIKAVEYLKKFRIVKLKLLEVK